MSDAIKDAIAKTPDGVIFVRLADNSYLVARSADDALGMIRDCNRKSISEGDRSSTRRDQSKTLILASGAVEVTLANGVAIVLLPFDPNVDNPQRTLLSLLLEQKFVTGEQVTALNESLEAPSLGTVAKL